MKNSLLRHKNFKLLLKLFCIPLIILISIAGHFILQYSFNLLFLSNLSLWIGSLIGGIPLLKKTYDDLRAQKLSLDYVAFLAISISFGGHYYLVSVVIMLMLSGGYALEEYGMLAAKESLTALMSRIPTFVQGWQNDHVTETYPINTIIVGQEILVRKGEVIPLDGILCSKLAEIDESSISGEPYFIEKNQGAPIRSGTLNIGNPIVIRVTSTDEHSSYRQIINMVKQAQLEKSPMIRLADRYSVVFIGITFSIAFLTYMLTRDMQKVLAVLVIATPCPLILAPPIALMGGVSAASRRKIMVKNLASLEALSRVQALIFDKTGTLTLGRPTVKRVSTYTTLYDEDYLIGLSASIEKNSLHPLAKAVVQYAKDKQITDVLIEKIEETVGHGIEGSVNGQHYRLSKIPQSRGMTIGLFSSENELLLQFDFEDQLKPNSSHILKNLIKKGLTLFLFTGDKKERTAELVAPLQLDISIEADCSPEQKKEKIMALKKKGLITAMIGDGINDAPALSAADVGLVFSHQEQTASTDAADIIFLDGDLSLVLEAIQLASHTISIATRCIIWGIAASSLGMLAASTGFLPPIYGAFLQEGIDIAVILYALQVRKF